MNARSLTSQPRPRAHTAGRWGSSSRRLGEHRPALETTSLRVLILLARAGFPVPASAKEDHVLLNGCEVALALGRRVHLADPHRPALRAAAGHDPRLL